MEYQALSDWFVVDSDNPRPDPIDPLSLLIVLAVCAAFGYIIFWRP